MGAATLVSVEDYLSTSYSPDREYIDGRIVERNLGEKTHSSIQANLIIILGPDARNSESRSSLSSAFKSVRRDFEFPT